MKGKWIGFVTACALLAAWGATVQADPPPPTLWTTRVGSSHADYAHAIALDGTGNIYITGLTYGDVGGPNQGGEDTFIVKCDSGGTVQWARQFGSSSDDHAGGVAIDSSGNSYITGYTDAIYDPGEPPEPRYAFIVKYDSGGTLQWTRQISTGEDEGGTGIAVDSSGSNYISGWTTGDLAAPCQGPSDAFIAKHDSGGTVQWIRQVGTSAGENAWGIAVDAGGNSYITGSTNGDFGGPNQGASDVYVVKFDSGGTEQWARQIGTSEAEWVDGIAVDSTGNSYITGFTEGDMAGPAQGSSDAFIVKYDSGGTEQWVRQIGTSERDRAYGIAVDGSGNIYIAGRTEGDLAGPNQGGRDIFIIKYDSGGTEQWRHQIGDSRSDVARGIGLDANGNIYITGYTIGDLWGPDYGDMDAFIMAFGNTAAEVSLDIKPGSWPNPLNPMGKGVLPVAVCGSDEFDVMTIDAETLLLGREGIDGLVPLRWSYEDVAAPFEGEPCDGHDLNGDGFIDLTLKFSTQELMSALGLGDLTGQTIPLLLTGSLMDGTPLEGIDCVWVLAPGDANMDGLVDGLDYVIWSRNYERSVGANAWGRGDFNEDGIVDGLDYIAWSSNYKQDSSGQVPEPATLALLALGALALIHRSRHKA